MKYTVIIVLLLLALFIGAYLGRKTISPCEPVIKTKIVIDTVETERVVMDTVYRDKVVTRYLKLMDTIRDTLKLVDSVAVEVPIYKYVYNKDSSYYLEISGYEVTLDKLIYYPKTIYKTKTISKQSKWGIGIHGGYGFSMGNTVKAHPYIGIGINYNILNF